MSEERKDKPTKLEHMKRSLSELDKEIEELEKLLSRIYENWAELEEMLRTKKFHSLRGLKFVKVEGKNAVFRFTP